MTFRLWIAGDPIDDAYFYGHQSGDRFHIETRFYCDGGALNVLSNAISILENTDKVDLRETMNLDPQTYTPMLTRLIDKSTNSTISFWNVESIRLKEINSFPWYDLKNVRQRPGGIVLSDYNKGSLNRQTYPESIEANHLDQKKLKFLVADSRYRTLHKDFMSLASTKIWHATGDEYDWDWANYMGFDYVFHTNGANRVYLFAVSRNYTGQRPIVLEVPDTKAVDTCGAGDTFTAAVGSYLAVHHERPIDMVLLEEAGKFAIECCQEVIQLPRTAVTTKRL
jgi:bifunctional ADP-heptose synthase (sugar kinase/adenylyltransferase)